jgi:hypothetical protein
MDNKLRAFDARLLVSLSISGHEDADPDDNAGDNFAWPLLTVNGKWAMQQVEFSPRLHLSHKTQSVGLWPVVGQNRRGIQIFRTVFDQESNLVFFVLIRTMTKPGCNSDGLQPASVRRWSKDASWTLAKEGLVVCPKFLFLACCSRNNQKFLTIIFPQLQTGFEI